MEICWEEILVSYSCLSFLEIWINESLELILDAIESFNIYSFSSYFSAFFISSKALDNASSLVFNIYSLFILTVLIILISRTSFSFIFSCTCYFLSSVSLSIFAYLRFLKLLLLIFYLLIVFLNISTLEISYILTFLHTCVIISLFLYFISFYFVIIVFVSF